MASVPAWGEGGGGGGGGGSGHDRAIRSGSGSALTLRSMRKELEGLRRGLGTSADSSGRRQVARARIRKGEGACAQLQGVLQVLRSGEASEAGREAAEDFSAALREFEESRDAYLAAEERAGRVAIGSMDLEAGTGSARGRTDTEVEKQHLEQSMEHAMRAEETDLALALAQERRDMASAIHHEAAGLKEVTQEVAQLIDQQGEQVDTIGDSVDEAKESVEKGNADLESAISYQKALRNKWCFCLIVFIIILAAICIPVLITATKQS